MRIRGQTFGCLQPDTIDIHIGYNYGHNNGGGLRRFKCKEVPQECRMPNTFVWLILNEKHEVIKIVKMNRQEVVNNS